VSATLKNTIKYAPKRMKRTYNDISSILYKGTFHVLIMESRKAKKKTGFAKPSVGLESESLRNIRYNFGEVRYENIIRCLYVRANQIARIVSLRRRRLQSFMV
jgi:hypothetical protein